MPNMRIILDGDGAFPDLREKPDRIVEAEVVAVTRLPGGMTSGNSSVMLRIDLPDGRVVLAQTSVKLWQAAAAAFAGADERDAQNAGRGSH